MAHIREKSSFGLTLLLGFLMALGPLSTDLYLPSLPVMARFFNVQPGDVQLTLSAYILGYALFLPVYGPLSDRKGRRFILFIGLFIFAISNFLAAFSPNLETLIACRFVQGAGSAGPIVIVRAIVRDLYEGRKAAQALARLGMVMGVVPAIAPVLGVVFEAWFGWRSHFIISFLLVCGLIVWAWRALPETLVERLLAPFSLLAIFQGFAHLLRDARFLPYGILSAATYSGLFAFISGASFVYQHYFGASSLSFALSFIVMVSGYMVGTFISQRMALTHAPAQLLRLGAILQACGGALMVVGLLWDPHQTLMVTIPMALYSSGVGFSLPQSMAAAMMPFPERAGTASSLLGTLQMSSAALVGSLVGAWIAQGPMVLAGVIALCGLVALAVQPFLVGES